MNYTHDEMLALINQARNRIETTGRENYTSREDTTKTADLAHFSEKPREVYKNKKIKKVNNISRLSEESNGICPTDPIESASPEVSPEGLEGQEEEVMSCPPATTSSRVYEGIEAFHNKTAKGIKLNVTLQNADDAEFGATLDLTGELKRQDRFRELKEYAGDDDYFKEFVVELKSHYQKDKDSTWAIGRLHKRGKREQWVGNAIVLAKIQDNIITEVSMWLEAERYDFALDIELNPNQDKYYHSGGRYGSIKRTSKVPRLATMERTFHR